MLTFEEKLAIFESFPQLTRKNVSLGRVNFHYEESVMEKKIVVYHLHPKGNGFVYAELIENDYEIDQKGMVNIRDFSEEDLRKIISQSIDSLSEKEPLEEIWVNDAKFILTLRNDFDSWNIYADELLDATFATYSAAVDYLHQEGFLIKSN